MAEERDERVVWGLLDKVHPHELILNVMVLYEN
jgi:hypothetical protein